MKRLITGKLLEWKNNINKKPLIIYGARQVGKSYISVEFGKENYINTVYLNFEGNKDLCSIFDQNLEPARIIREIEALVSQKISKLHTLIIFDEIQACEKALTSLKYFCEKEPEYHIIGAGSLLGLAVNRGTFSYPVGKVDMVTMHPMNFKEFLWAIDKTDLVEFIEEGFNTNLPLSNALHELALEKYRIYLIVGGMPEAVGEYVRQKNFDYVKNAQYRIFNAYTSDMIKYSSKTEAMRTIDVYDSIPFQLARENNKFQYNLIKSGARASVYEFSMKWLKLAGVALNCSKIREGKLPLEFYKDALSYKIYMSDVGILTAKSNYPTVKLLSDLNIGGEAKGALTENYIAQELTASGYQIYYWESNGMAELDFVIQKGDNIIAIEGKSADNVKAKSMVLFMKKYELEFAIRISGKNFGFENKIKSVPLYAVFCI